MLVPEAGDEIQNIKSGLMEIADAFIINKADRDGADIFINNLKKIILQKNEHLPVFKTVASKNEGIDEITNFILSQPQIKNSRRELLLTQKAYNIIQQKMMAGINKKKLQQDIAKALKVEGFNLYSFVDNYIVSG
jgi:LAO/AO transport system kinase